VGIEEMTDGLRAAFSDPRAAAAARDRLAPGAATEMHDDVTGLDQSRDLLALERAGRFAIHPPWLAPPDDAIGIEIDPGHAFGSGSHPSTRLALQLLGDEAIGAIAVADVGCGSGVLGIGAALMGADVLAVDVDPAAIEATRANADRNGVADRLDTRLGSAGLVAPGTALVIVNVTIDIHETVAAHLNAPTRVIAAGLLAEEQVERAASTYAMTIERQLSHDGWGAAVLGSPRVGSGLSPPA
jgi:ribosomal protein L11 methyltransferase